MNLKNIRNFSIIAHIDHGKSTLADRFIEVTHTIEKRKMQDQVLDRMELERERGITIKMKPIRMAYSFGGEDYILNLIDTPGHIDFSYEVSRALRAVEGSILLIDATQGVQAQTLTTLNMARELGLTIIPVVSKIDSPLARTEEVKKEVAQLLNCKIEEVLGVSGKTGDGVEKLLEEIIKKVSPPEEEYSQNQNQKELRALVFDFKYSNHIGVVVFVRVMDGEIKKGSQLFFAVSKEKFEAGEVGVFSPLEVPVEKLSAGEIGYIVTGIKRPGIASVGDTITYAKNPSPALSGYMSPIPVVWASVYSESQDDFDFLRQALGRLKLTDSSFTYEEETSGILGRGFRCGFLGMLHLEIITERLRREFNLNLIVTLPSITYEVELKNGKKEIIYSSVFFPEEYLIAKVMEPWVKIRIITPPKYLGGIMQLLYSHEALAGETEVFGDNRIILFVGMPLRELMRGFFDEIKSVSSGFASLLYEIEEMKEADVVRLDILVADEIVPAFSRVISRKRAEEEAEKAVEKLHSVLSRQLFTTKIQGKAMGRILASRTLSALKKDVTGYLYGGDITRKKKLWEKQKKGKKKLKERGKVDISQDVFVKMMRND